MVVIVTFDVSVGRHAVAEQLHVRLRRLHPDSRSCHNKSIEFQADERILARGKNRPHPSFLEPRLVSEVKRTWDILFRHRDVYIYDISGGGGGGGSISGCRKPLFSFLFPTEKQQDRTSARSSISSSSGAPGRCSTYSVIPDKFETVPHGHTHWRKHTDQHQHHLLWCSLLREMRISSHRRAAVLDVLSHPDLYPAGVFFFFKFTFSGCEKQPV